MTRTKLDSWSRYEQDETVLYALVASDRPRTIRYVGITRDPEARLRQHTKRVRFGTQVQQWAREVRERGAAVQMLTLDVFPCRSLAVEREWRVIARFARRGMCDLNLASDWSAAFFAMCQSQRIRNATAA